MPSVLSTSVLAGSADRIAVLVNPKAGVRDARPRADRLVEILRQRGFSTEISTDLAAAASMADQWHAAGRLLAFVGVGGDGTAGRVSRLACQQCGNTGGQATRGTHPITIDRARGSGL